MGTHPRAGVSLPEAFFREKEGRGALSEHGETEWKERGDFRGFAVDYAPLSFCLKNRGI